MTAEIEYGVVHNAADRDAIFSVRMVVFVEEQAVPPEEELDAYDIAATHFYARLTGADTDQSIIATARLLDKGNGLAKIGRVAVLKPYRNQGIGFDLMRAVESHAAAVSFVEAALEAQVHAIPFYERLGYTAEGPVFLDAGIEHRLMKKRLV